MGLVDFFKNLFGDSKNSSSKSINLTRVKNNIVNSLRSQYDLSFEGKIEKDSDGGQYVKLTHSLTHSSYKGGIFCKILVFPSGSLSVEFVFDKIDETPEVTQLLHDFNYESAFLAAYVRDDGYLLVHYNVAYLDESEMWDNIRRSLNSLSNEDIEKNLQQLTRLTYSND